MIKRLLLLLMLVSFGGLVKSQTDTTAYESQRTKINTLLSQRSAKFGQYEESLNTKTGIFGFQTKDDIRNSNEILREITLNDNNIFKELKVLLDYKDLQYQQVKSNITSNADRLQSYMNAIKKLQEQNVYLREELKNKESSDRFAWYLITFLIFIILGMAVFFFRKVKLTKNSVSLK
jgi:hypothetical protein